MTDLIRNSTRNLIANTALSAAAASYLFTPKIGALVALTNLALSKLNPEPTQAWYPLQKGRDEVRTYWEKKSPPLISIVLAAHILVRALSIRSFTKASFFRFFATNQNVSSPFICRAIFYTLAEEIVFRGFVQEKVKDIQNYCFGADEASSRYKTRAALSACCTLILKRAFSKRAADDPLYLVVCAICFAAFRELRTSLYYSTCVNFHFTAAKLTRYLLMPEEF